MIPTNLTLVLTASKHVLKPYIILIPAEIRYKIGTPSKQRCNIAF